jgi:ribosomal protein S20
MKERTMTKDSEKTMIKTYLTAKHTYTTDQINTAIQQAQSEADNARKQAEHFEAVLAGYRKASKERGGRNPVA